ncbi:hypothetical protein Nepgr_031828 [Nepenthes gracilis]|uniref:Uncharacterized protein n=1 Tax=Nepenthes gracilis TaxID=150966 RepID=A0AAD3Y769_NEPGR|nr:hypothetical protein Nepgr_031828 [Nepenthes gracilis]
MQDQPEVTKGSVVGDSLLQNDNLASVLIIGENLIDTTGGKGFSTDIPSPLYADGMSPSIEGIGPKSILKKQNRQKKKSILLLLFLKFSDVGGMFED